MTVAPVDWIVNATAFAARFGSMFPVQESAYADAVVAAVAVTIVITVPVPDTVLDATVTVPAPVIVHVAEASSVVQILLPAVVRTIAEPTLMMPENVAPKTILFGTRPAATTATSEASFATRVADDVTPVTVYAPVNVF